ncbi:MAG: outer membrane beta-barrel protein [Polyangia bacterium]
MPPRTHPVAIATLLAASLASGRAQAERGELQLGVQPAYAITYVDQRSPSGGGGDARFQYCITDAVGVQLVGGLTAHPLEASEELKLSAGLLQTFYANLGVVYALDVVRIVPFFEASVGVLGTLVRTDRDAKSAINVGAMLGLGADYLINRRVSVGVGLRYHASLSDLSRLPLYLTVGPRLQLRFGL